MADIERIRRLFLHWKRRLTGGRAPLDFADEQPLQAGLLSAEQMQQHGKALAGAHRITAKPAPNTLLRRLAANEDVLIEVCTLLTTAVSANRRVTPAAEWLLDNFYLIEEQIRTAKRHFPKGYSRELPRLERGTSQGLPRVYDLALETISHGDGRVDPQSLRRFVAAYQTVTPLKLGELWAIPIMLRLALIENLRRVAMRVAAGMIDRGIATSWADKMVEIAERDPKNLILVIADMARSNPPMTTQFVAEFVRRLQGQSATLALPLTWIERLLSDSHQTTEQLIQQESQKQAATQVSISNSIASLRFLGAMDWREFVETMSVVENILREDPIGVYSRMDFATRDRYRHAVERAAKTGNLSEPEVAAKAIELANARVSVLAVAGYASEARVRDRAAHVGFYLIDAGLPLLERAAAVRLPFADALRRYGRRWPLPLYLGSIAVFTLLLAAAVLMRVEIRPGIEWLLAVVGVLVLLSISQMGVALTNWLATLLVVPDTLPKLDFSKGIASDATTLVAIPTMLTSTSGIEHLTEALEVRFLANQDDNLRFGLLTDFRDAEEETLDEDAAFLAQAEARIAELNEKYPRDGSKGGGNFYLFHRPRRWNAGERIWMGFERKRGKLAELNALLRGGAADCFSSIVGDRAWLAGVNYVITLDTDTQLPRDAARQFAGTMAHPLNRASFDESKQRVTAGYGILQPRVGTSLTAVNQSHYAKLFGSEPGIDPYTRAISDVYQDGFGEGSFVGKGIYDVDAFELALKSRFPENRILSHDLLEGCYARAALLSDVQLYEEYPSRYSADVSRRHRWIRGDWQIASWLLRRVPVTSEGAANPRQKNPLSMLSQWKIFDNLRRSLVPVALTFSLLLGWSMLSPAWLWTLLVLGVMLLPQLIAAVVAMLDKADDMPFGQHASATIRSMGGHVLQAGFTLACLPYEAYFSLDAIVRTNWRIFVTRRHLLEWMPSASLGTTPSQDADTNGLLATYRTMWIAPATGAIATCQLAMSVPAALPAALPILLLWVLSPLLAWRVSQPRTRRAARLNPFQLVFLRKTARKTWAFFETFVGPQ
ncbi:MAG: glycosyltransferase family 2 protein, partial [Usitatibacteraceae bacterium]